MFLFAFRFQTGVCSGFFLAGLKRLTTPENDVVAKSSSCSYRCVQATGASHFMLFINV